MNRKVLELFRDRTESVFLNLSAYDISSEASRSMLYELLSNLPQEACGRITFEILESEKIRDFNEMVNFLNEIRKFGDSPRQSGLYQDRRRPHHQLR